MNHTSRKIEIAYTADAVSAGGESVAQRNPIKIFIALMDDGSRWYSVQHLSTLYNTRAELYRGVNIERVPDDHTVEIDEPVQTVEQFEQVVKKIEEH